ncbi:MAG: hypothetical protein LBI95_01750 [Holosporales bacterium]|nr:hypothetical protein [Holosporales bacterium]
MVYCLFRLSCRSHVMFESGRFVQDLIGKGKEIAYIYFVSKYYKNHLTCFTAYSNWVMQESCYV